MVFKNSKNKTLNTCIIKGQKEGAEQGGRIIDI